MKQAKGSLRFKISLFLMVFLLICGSTPIYANQDVKNLAVAQNLNAVSVFKINDRLASKDLSDNLINTTFMFDQESILTITSQSDIAYVYILFDRPPFPYTVHYENISQDAGISGFLHELIPLKVASKNITINMPEGRVASLYVYSAGQLPKNVQQWNPPCQDADLLVLPAHGDDEALYFGPAIAISVAQGKQVQVAYLVDHSLTDRRRPHETLDSLWELGVTAYPIFGAYKDMQSRSLAHAKTIYPEAELLKTQVDLIRRFKPEVIMSHDFAGEYGHGAHMLVSDVLTKAIHLSNDVSYNPVSAFMYGLFQPLKVYIHLYAQHEIFLDIYQPLDYFDGRTSFQVAKDAYEKHISQHIWPLKVIDYTIGDVRRFGLYATWVGPDTSNLLFENIPAQLVLPEKPQPVIHILPDITHPIQKDFLHAMEIIVFVGLGILLVTLIRLGFRAKKKTRRS